MTDRANIKLDREEYDKHNARRQEMGLTWAEYINGQAPELPDATVDYAEIERRVARAVRSELPNR